MQALGIKELQTNPASLTKALDRNEYTLITKHSKPIGLAVSFDDEILNRGLKTALLVDAYKSAAISLGQFANALNISHKSAMQMLSLMQVDVIDYELDDELESLAELL